jgi:hypothetical protein
MESCYVHILVHTHIFDALLVCCACGRQDKIHTKSSGLVPQFAERISRFSLIMGPVAHLVNTSNATSGSEAPNA